MEYKTTGTYLKVDSLEMLNQLNRGDNQFVIFDMFDNVHKRDNLVMYDLQEISDSVGIDFIYVLGKFNERYKQCLKLTEDTLTLLQVN